VAKSRPVSDNGREPLDRTIASNASVRRDITAQRPALSKSAGLATSALNSMGGRGPDPSRSERGQAESTRPGRVVRWDVWPRQALALGVDERATGGRRSSDRRLFRRQSRHCCVKRTICVYLRDLWAHCDGWSAFVSSCVRCPLCFSLCALCLCGSAGVLARLQIHLRVHGVERHCRFELSERYLVVDGVRVELVGRPETDGRDTKETRSGASVG
jgi:hypothetical protein